MKILERLRRAGCVATGAATFAFFFAIGTIVSLVSADWLTTIQALVVTAVFAGIAVWLARRHSALPRE